MKTINEILKEIWVPIERCTGRVVQDIDTEGCDDSLFIFFNDGTITTFVAKRSYEDCDIIYNRVPDTPCHNFLVEHGIMTQEEIDKACEEEKIRNAKEREKSQRAQYEELKKKFEGGSK